MTRLQAFNFYKETWYLKLDCVWYFYAAKRMFALVWSALEGYICGLYFCRDHRLERMEAMEKQIASLTGLVQSVLTRAPDSDST